MQREDTLGICLSGLCVVHCLGIPILIALSPALGWMEQEWVHLLLACLALRPLVMALLRAMPVAPRGGAWLGAFAVAALTLVMAGPAEAAAVYLALFLLGLGLFPRSAAQA